MARTARTTRKKQGESPAQTDPRAPLDGVAFLAAAKPVLERLADDLRERALASPEASRALKERHAKEKEGERTAETFAEWIEALAVQVAAAWLLSCVFVRTLEDRGLARQARLAGPGATDSQRLFFQLAPSLTERDYLLAVFREVARHPAGAALFDAKHSPVWMLSPSAEAAKELLALFRTPGAEAPAFRFGQSSTRFLGDLYQDLSEAVRKRYALLQTPEFVEQFIRQRTLEPAIARFGLDDTTVIDPTCGSGHFLLGAFEDLFEHRLRAEPGVDRRVAAARALDAVTGADINPYAVAIARFRLTLAFLEKAGITRFADAPALPLHVVVADSLLHNAQHPQMDLVELPGQSVSRWAGELYALEDEKAAREMLSRRYAAVVGNPPYIVVQDAVLRDRYRRMYRSAYMQYSLASPFCERFFQLARERGYVGQITANSFMKREFGKKLIEEVLPGVNLEMIVNTAGAYIPGHGTPTVLLFGTNEPPREREVHAVLAKRGEPSTPDDPARGAVWSSIMGHWIEVGFDDEYISVARVEREMLSKHPWSLGGGGAGELKEILERRGQSRLADITLSIGRVAHTGNDETYVAPEHALLRKGLESTQTAPFVEGEVVRDWALGSYTHALFPYDSDLRVIRGVQDARLNVLWPFRTLLWERREPNGTHREIGLTWFQYSRFHPERFRRTGIAFAFVATHNHFVLDPGGKVFNRSAPIIKMPEIASEDNHLALLAYLNSSTAAFFFRQVGHSKGAQGVNEGHKSEQWEQFLEYSGTLVGSIPVPPAVVSLAPLGRAADALAQELKGRNSTEAFHRLVALQEQIDWEVYRLFGLVEADAIPRLPEALPPGSRAFEWILDRDLPTTAWFDRNQYPRPTGDRPDDVIAIIESNPFLRLIEQPEYKRRWTIRDLGAATAAAEREATLAGLEKTLAAETEPRRLPGHADLAAEEAVPFLAALRFTDSGLAKHAAWLACWDAQRAEDAGQNVKPEVPPKYGNDDYASPAAWRLRGKLDVPKERFISYPFCESDEDHEPIFGWAGWDHLQRAQALACLYMRRKDHEGWAKERLVPMLAGLLELIPWLKQWHNAPSADYGGLPLGDYFDQFLEGECRQHAFTRDALLAWRPPQKRRTPRGGSAATTRAGADLDDGTAPAAKPRARRKKAAAPAGAETPNPEEPDAPADPSA